MTSWRESIASALKKTKNTTRTSRPGAKKKMEDGYGRSGATGMRQVLSGFCLLKKKEEQEKGKDGGGKRETLGGAGCWLYRRGAT